MFEGGGSEPPGPGKNSTGLGVFRYETSCGTVWGHKGNIPGGYTQFMAANSTGRRSSARRTWPCAQRWRANDRRFDGRDRVVVHMSPRAFVPGSEKTSGRGSRSEPL